MTSKRPDAPHLCAGCGQLGTCPLGEPYLEDGVWKVQCGSSPRVLSLRYGWLWECDE